MGAGLDMSVGLVLLEASWVTWARTIAAGVFAVVLVGYLVFEVVQLVRLVRARHGWVLAPGVVVAEQVQPDPEQPRRWPIVAFTDPVTGQTRQHTAKEAYRGRRGWDRGASLPVRINPRDPAQVLCVDEGGRGLVRRAGVLVGALVLLALAVALAIAGWHELS